MSLKLSQKQQSELKVCKYFASPHWTFEYNTYKTQSGKNLSLQEDPNGYSPEEAYFRLNERGETMLKIYKVEEFLGLLWGRIWADRTIHELWEPSLACRAGWGLGLIDLLDKDMPDEVFEYICKNVCGGTHTEDFKQIRNN